MAELLLGEMVREWLYGAGGVDVEGARNEDDSAGEMIDAANHDGGGAAKRGNERVKPDVVTFTAVIDAWVKCTALAHDYHYEQPPSSSSGEDDGDSDAASDKPSSGSRTPTSSTGENSKDKAARTRRGSWRGHTREDYCLRMEFNKSGSGSSRRMGIQQSTGTVSINEVPVSPIG